MEREEGKIIWSSLWELKNLRDWVKRTLTFISCLSLENLVEESLELNPALVEFLFHWIV
jgi:hypothetical protein